MVTANKNMIVFWISLLTASVLAVDAAAASGPTETFSCSYEIKKTCTSGKATVVIKDGIVQEISFDNFFCGLSGRPGYSCDITSSRTGPDKWHQGEGKTTIGFADSMNPDGPDSLSISIRKDSLFLDFSNAQSGGKCGAGAELPKSVTISRKSKVCKVRP